MPDVVHIGRKKGGGSVVGYSTTHPHKEQAINNALAKLRNFEVEIKDVEC